MHASAQVDTCLYVRGKLYMSLSKVATEARLVHYIHVLFLICTKAVVVPFELWLRMMSRSGRLSVVVQEGQEGAARASCHQECLWRAFQHRPGLCSRAHS